MKRLVFLGSKPIGASCLEYLLTHSESLGIEVIAIGTQIRKEFDSGVKTVQELADTHFIPILKSEDDIPECDIIYSVQYHNILEKRHISRAKQIAVNLHLAPLPEYRGCNQFSFAIMNEENEFGVSIHIIDERIDHGALLFEKRFPIHQDIWVEELVQISVENGLSLFKETITDIVQNNVSPITKSQNVPSRLYYRKDINKLKHINWQDDALLNYRKIRATMMPGFEPPFFYLNYQKFFIQKQQ